MSTKKAGGSAFFHEINRARLAAELLSDYLGRMDGAGPTTIAVLIAKMALQLTTIFSALTALDRIGREAKVERVNS